VCKNYAHAGCLPLESQNITLKEGMYMKHTPSILVIIACALFISVIAFGQIAPQEPKHAQLPDMAGYDWSSENQVPSAVADDWICENGMPINQIVWWGSYYQPGIYPYKTSDNWPDPTYPNNVTPETVKGFTILIYANDGPGGSKSWNSPGAMLYNSYVAIEDTNESLFGVASKPGGQQENVWQYTALLDPKDWFYQEQGVKYWISIVADNDLGNTTFLPMYQWGWHQTDKELYGFGDDAVQNGYNPNQMWDLLVDTEMAFKLYSVPEPSMIVLVMSSLGMLGMYIRRRSN
jgi:hypothetical protein